MGKTFMQHGGPVSQDKPSSGQDKTASAQEKPVEAVLWPKVVLDAFGSAQAASEAWGRVNRMARLSRYWVNFGDKGGRYALLSGRLFAGVETGVIRAPRARIVEGWVKAWPLEQRTEVKSFGWNGERQDLAHLGECDYARAILIAQGSALLWLPVVCVDGEGER
jgi:hypothetical protein